MTLHKVRICKCGHEEAGHDEEGCTVCRGVVSPLGTPPCPKFRLRGHAGQRDGAITWDSSGPSPTMPQGRTRPVTVDGGALLRALDSVIAAFGVLRAELVRARGFEKGGPSMRGAHRENGAGVDRRSPTPRDGAAAAGDRKVSPGGAAPRSGMPALHRAILTALAQHQGGLTKAKILLFADYRSSGATSRAFAELRREGLVEAEGDRLVLTTAGADALGPWEPLPTGDALREGLIAGTIGRLSGVERALLQVIVAAPDRDPVAKGTVLDLADYASSGATSRAFARLVKYGYVKPAGRGALVASEELFS